MTPTLKQMGDFPARRTSRAQAFRGLISGDFTSRIYPYGPPHHLRAIVAMMEWSDARARVLEQREAIRRARRVKRLRFTMRPVEAVARSSWPKPASPTIASRLGFGVLLGLGLGQYWKRRAERAPLVSSR